MPSIIYEVTEITTGLKVKMTISGVNRQTCSPSQGIIGLHSLLSSAHNAHFSKIVRASISAFSSPGTSNLLVNVRDTSVFARASLFASLKLPELSPKVLGRQKESIQEREEMLMQVKDNANLRHLNKPTSTWWQGHPSLGKNIDAKGHRQRGPTEMTVCHNVWQSISTL